MPSRGLWTISSPDKDIQANFHFSFFHSRFQNFSNILLLSSNENFSDRSSLWIEMLESKFFESLKRRKILCFLLFFPKIIESIHLSNSRMNRKKPRTNWSVEFFFLHDSRSIESVTSDEDHRVAGSRESVIKLHTKVALIELAADFVPFEKFRFSRGIRRFLRVVCEINFTTFVFWSISRREDDESNFAIINSFVARY